MISSRNESYGFAERTEKNLHYIQLEREEGKDVHEVTQIVNSLLGLVIFPWEKHFKNTAESERLDKLYEKGWPRWDVTKGTDVCRTLGELLRHLCNGIVHSHISFSSESPMPKEVIITVDDYHSEKDKEPYWSASISADDLRDFCYQFVDLVKNAVG